MANAKKGGKGKLAKMTEEEKLLHIEKISIAAENKRKESEEIALKQLKEKLLQEEKNTKINSLKLQSQWRVIMREAKSSELKKDIEVLNHTFDRIVDQKDSIIKSLLKDIEEAEDQHQTAIKSHLYNLQKLLEFQSVRLLQADEDFAKEFDALNDEFKKERTNLIEQHAKEMEEMADILFTMEHDFEEAESDARQEFHSLYDEVKNKNLEEKHALRIQLEGQVEELWKSFQTALKNYNDQTEERKNAFEALKIKDDRNTQEMDMQMRKIQRIQDRISQVKAKMASITKEYEEKNRVIKEERESIAHQYHQLKDQMNKFREKQRSELTTLIIQSNSVIKELERKKEKGEKILKLAERCRKLETEEEKILPFYSTSLNVLEEKQVEEFNQEKPSEPLAELFHEYSSLENFWKRYNKVLLDKIALSNEKNALCQENQQLKSLLKQYLDGISVNDEILTKANPLFIINNKTNVSLAVPVTDTRVQYKRPVTVIEASHIVKNIV
ncbi:dynein regulatory complex subunit 2 isoform X1 [Hydra vulgaris]|uniref:dynein regulatory complex subunit 2 isoform X1 n=1 Tax=Hydra vulgaris TaxID=6087 RepID=UPI001F5FDFEC|nr:dynein regulatory complex subunit 2 [Hydra vulgaris]